MIALLCLAVFICLAVFAYLSFAITSGKIGTGRGQVDRRKEPGQFWFDVFILAAMAGVVTYVTWLIIQVYLPYLRY